MNKEERTEKRLLVENADDYKDEQAALENAVIVDIIMTQPGVADLFPRFEDSLSIRDYNQIMKKRGSWDRGARRWVVRTREAKKIASMLESEGFVVAIDLPTILASKKEEL